MRLQTPLSAIGHAVPAQILGILAKADDWFSPGQLAAVLGDRSKQGIRNGIDALEEEGLVETLNRGNRRLARLNREHLAAPYIIALANLRTEFIEKLQAEVAGWPVPPLYAALFGSGARGEMRLDSDIDLFFLRPEGAGEGWDDAVFELASKASRWTGNDVRPLIFSEEEARGASATESVVRAIVDEGVSFAGDRIRFKRLVNAS